MKRPLLISNQPASHQTDWPSAAASSCTRRPLPKKPQPTPPWCPSRIFKSSSLLTDCWLSRESGWGSARETDRHMIIPGQSLEFNPRRMHWFSPALSLCSCLEDPNGHHIVISISIIQLPSTTQQSLCSSPECRNKRHFSFPLYVWLCSIFDAWRKPEPFNDKNPHTRCALAFVPKSDLHASSKLTRNTDPRRPFQRPPARENPRYAVITVNLIWRFRPILPMHVCSSGTQPHPLSFIEPITSCGEHWEYTVPIEGGIYRQ